MKNTYYEDKSFDSTFKITTQGLSKRTFYSVNNDIFKTDDSVFNKDAARFVVSLQGLVNRDYGDVHESLINIDGGETDRFWLKYMMEKGKSFEGFDEIRIESIEQFLNCFSAQIAQCGIVLWDSEVPATANVAATVCGLDGYIPVQNDQSVGSFYNYLCEKCNPEIKMNLCKLFGKNGSVYNDTFKGCGSAKCDVYLWALEKFMPRCSSHYIAYILDGAGCVRDSRFEKLPNAKTPFGNCIYNHDYYIARRCFFFDLTCVDIEHPCDDIEQPLGSDLKTLKKILMARYERAGGAFGQILGFPPWWIKYTTHYKMGVLLPTTLEWTYVALATAYNLAKEADAAQPCSMANASLYYKYKSSYESYKNTKPQEKLTYNRNVKYFTFFGGDYDSSAWLKAHVYNYWVKQNDRGQKPINWAFNPNLSQRAPMIFDYVYENKTDNDYFIAGDSGAGYVIPAALFSSCQERDLPDAGDEWARYCEYYYKKHDLDCTGFIINGNYPMTDEIMEIFNKFSKTGNFHNAQNSLVCIYKGVPYVYLHNGVSGKTGKIENSIKAMYSHMFTRMKDYNFSAYRNVCDSPFEMYTLVEQFIEYAKTENPNYDYKYVDYATYFDLLIQSQQGDIVE